MNKKIVISVLLVVVLFVGGLLGFVIIPNSVNKFKAATGNPTTHDSVSGNGGNAVMVGEYLYFVNGFKSNSTGSLNYKDNEYNKVKGEGAIYRVKMENGRPEYDNSYLDYLDDWDEFGEYDRLDPRQKIAYAKAMDKYIKSNATKKQKDTNLQLVVPKVAGWERSAIWVFGNNLVYTSPNNQKDKYGQLQRDKVDFFRCDLNGKNHRKLYTTRSTSVGQNAMTVVNVEGKTYLLVADGDGRLVRVDMNGKTSTISTKMDNYTFPIVTSYYKGYELNLTEGEQTLTLADDRASLENSYSGMMQYVFYTETREEDDAFRGNVFWRYNIVTGQKDKLRHDHNNHRMLALGNGALVFETTFETIDEHAGPRGLYVVQNAVDACDFDLANVRKHLMAQPLDGSEGIFVSEERTEANAFRYITLTDGRLFVYDYEQNASYSPYEIVIKQKGLPIDIRVSEILYVGSGSILFNSTSGTAVCIDFSGNVRMEVYATPDVSARVTVFQVLDKYGQINGTGYKFFFIKTLDEICDDHDDDHGHGHGKITVGSIVGIDGREYLLARLDTKYIDMPENS